MCFKEAVICSKFWEFQTVWYPVFCIPIYPSQKVPTIGGVILDVEDGTNFGCVIGIANERLEIRKIRERK